MKGKYMDSDKKNLAQNHLNISIAENVIIFFPPKMKNKFWMDPMLCWPQPFRECIRRDRKENQPASQATSETLEIPNTHFEYPPEFFSL